MLYDSALTPDAGGLTHAFLYSAPLLRHDFRKHRKQDVDVAVIATTTASATARSATPAPSVGMTDFSSLVRQAKALHLL